MYKMKNIIVTGGLGFIGTNFISYILDNHPEIESIAIFDNASLGDYSEENRKRIFSRSAMKKTKLMFGKINIEHLMEDFLHELFEKNDIDTIIHFAAESHVDNSITTSRPFILSNVLGTENLINSVVTYKKKCIRFHHVSTDEVFGSINQGSFSESSPYNPLNPYSASKAGSDHIVRAYGNTHNLQYTISNCSNNFGPFQNAEKLIPKVITNFHNNKEVGIYGSGNNIRDWLYVEDHCSAICKIITDGKVGETYCVGGGKELTNNEIVSLIADIMKRKKLCKDPHSLIKHIDDRKGHDFRYSIDISKIKKELDWSPKFDFESSIIKTINSFNFNEE